MALKFIRVQGFFLATAVHKDKIYHECQLNDHFDNIFC